MNNITSLGLGLAVISIISFTGCGDSEDSTPSNNTPVFETETISYEGNEYKTIQSPYTEKIWLDRNIGATKVCTKSRYDYVTDSKYYAADDATYVNEQKDCFGDYYQWGRLKDGHQASNSLITTTLASSVTNAGTKFINASSNDLRDWGHTADFDGTLRSFNWSKIDGDGVCPIGFRIPTETELKNEKFDYSSEIFSAFLNLSFSGSRFHDGTMYGQGNSGKLWTSNPINSTNSADPSSDVIIAVSAVGVHYGYNTVFGDDVPITSSTDFSRYGRDQALNIRCIKD